MELKFIDSLKFLNESLAKLASNLGPDKKLMCRKYFGDDTLFDLITRKGVYCYDYMNGWSKLHDTCLPPIEEFKSRLTGEELKPEEYEHAQNVWSAFNITSLKEYTELYMKVDVLLLGDIFEDFRVLGMTHFELDPAYYYTTPGFCLDACLKKTGVQLELLTDIDMVHFIKKGLRGGMVSCNHRHAKANNKYMGKFYDPTQPSVYILDVDANSLYGYACSEPLPWGGFEWLDVSNITTEWLLNVPVDAPEGYYLEVSLEYPDHLHDEHNYMPFCPTVSTPPALLGKKSFNLMQTLYDKERYVIHYRALQQALNHGLVLTEVHRGLKFNQSRWMKPYIEFNTTMRQRSKYKSEEEFWKLCVNSAFGKLIERTDKRINVQVCQSFEKSRKLFASRLMKEMIDCGKGLTLFHMQKKKIVYNRPLYAGCSILDISKCRMFEFYYDYLKRKFSSARLNYSDTDSLLVSIECEDLYEELWEDERLMSELDTSSYPKNHRMYSAVNKHVLGKFKDEAKGDIPTEFVGVRSKDYAKKKYFVSTGEVDVYMKKSKGTQKSVVKHVVKFEDFLKSVYSGPCFEKNNPNKIEFKNTRIVQKNFKITLEEFYKKALNPTDMKRCILGDKISTLAWGHRDIRNVDEVIQLMEEEEENASSEEEVEGLEEWDDGGDEGCEGAEEEGEEA